MRPALNNHESCSTILDVSSVTSSLPSHGDFDQCKSSVDVENCCVVKNTDKKSLHVAIYVCGRCIFSLVYIGETSCFISFSLAKELGVWEQRTRSALKVRYPNGVMQPTLGTIHPRITFWSR